MRKQWIVRVVGVALACTLAAGVLAQDDEGEQRRRRRPEGGRNGGKRQERMLKFAAPSVVMAAAELEAGKAAIEQYKTEAAEVEKGLGKVRGKYMREIHEAVRDGNKDEAEALVEKAKPEIVAAMKKLMDARIRCAESLIAVAKANPDAVAEKMVETQFERMKNMRRRRGRGGDRDGDRDGDRGGDRSSRRRRQKRDDGDDVIE